MRRIRITRISEQGRAIMVLAAFAFQVNGQNQTRVSDAHQIMESSIAATQRHWEARLRYTYNSVRRVGAATWLGALSLKMSM
jgi:hypothetical protein